MQMLTKHPDKNVTCLLAQTESCYRPYWRKQKVVIALTHDALISVLHNPI